MLSKIGWMKQAWSVWDSADSAMRRYRAHGRQARISCTWHEVPPAVAAGGRKTMRRSRRDGSYETAPARSAPAFGKQPLYHRVD